MTNKPYWQLSDQEVKYWISMGLFSDRCKEQIAVDECKRVIFKEIEPLLVFILSAMTKSIRFIGKVLKG